jgi:hypothetical protein
VSVGRGLGNRRCRKVEIEYRTGGGNMEPKEMKKIIADILRQIKLIKDNYTGEITIGINDGGVTYIRKSETLK